jgi:hypothetical protein
MINKFFGAFTIGRRHSLSEVEFIAAPTGLSQIDL